MNPFPNKTGWIATAIVAGIVGCSSVQAQVARTFDPVTGDWNLNTNWSGDFVPEGQFDESATINNADSVAQVGGAVPSVAALSVGPGRVEISASGALSTGPGASAGNGATTINNDGRINVASGGAFSPASLTLGGTLQLTGPSATVDVGSGGLAVNGGSHLVAQINSASFSPVAVDGLARIHGGNLDVDFSGFTPTAADVFNLIDANVINGSFDAVNVTGGPALQPYQTYAVSNRTGGSNGMVAQLQLENRLVLSIDRSTGVGSISNLAPDALNLDGYSVTSSLGSLGSASYNSFADQGLDSSSWEEIGTVSANAVSELRSVGVTSLASSSSRSIGNIYSPNYTELGVDPEDYVFEYTNADGVTIPGIVMYQGDKTHNNLVVNVDPATGDAVLVNESPISFSFDGYTLTSSSGAINASGWNSLEDQSAGGGDWFEIGSDANKIGELKKAGSTTLSQGTSFNLGAIFNTAGAQDLQLEFLMEGEAIGRVGVVDFLTPAPGGNGDFNGDGQVDADDLNGPQGWQARFGVDLGGSDFLAWQGNLTSSGAGAAAAAVPEPSATIIALLGAFVGCCCRRGGRR